MADVLLPFIRLGDKTLNGCTAVSAWGQDCPETKMKVYDVPAVCAGDEVLCSRRRGIHHVLAVCQDSWRLEIVDKQVAIQTDICSGCGSEFVATQKDKGHVTHAQVNPVVAAVLARREAAAAAKGIQTASATPGISAEEARLLVEQNEQEKKCKCGGPHPLIIVGDEVKPIGGYTGALRAPGLLFKQTGSSTETFNPQELENSKLIRRWAREASAYHEIPYVMLAAILEQENGQIVSTYRQTGQAGERFTQTNLNVIDKMTGGLLTNGWPSKIPYFGSKIAKSAAGSTGIMNMLRSTLDETVAYTHETYKRPMLPSDKNNINKGVAGVDVEADLYYGAAHIRQLIDRVVGNPCSKGEITLEQVRNVFRAYNGGFSAINPDADKYADDAMVKLKGAYNGSRVLYFYE